MHVLFPKHSLFTDLLFPIYLLDAKKCKVMLKGSCKAFGRYRTMLFFLTGIPMIFALKQYSWNQHGRLSHRL